MTQGSAEDARSGLDAFRTALRELGYVEGETITSSRDTRRGRPRDYLLLVTGGAALDARKLTSTIPIVVVAHPDPVGAGLVASLARPGGNVTGLSDVHGDLVAKRLELLKEIDPPVSRAAFLFNPAGPGASGQLEAVRAAARALSVSRPAISSSTGTRCCFITGSALPSSQPGVDCRRSAPKSSGSMLAV